MSSVGARIGAELALCGCQVAITDRFGPARAPTQRRSHCYLTKQHIHRGPKEETLKRVRAAVIEGEAAGLLGEPGPAGPPPNQDVKTAEGVAAMRRVRQADPAHLPPALTCIPS